MTNTGSEADKRDGGPGRIDQRRRLLLRNMCPEDELWGLEELAGAWARTTG